MAILLPVSQKDLPETYQLRETIDLSKQKQLALWLTLAGIILFAASFLLLTCIMAVGRGMGDIIVFSFNENTLPWVVLFWGIGVFFVLIILHEAAHGFFFWLYTRTMPKIAVKLSYAYAAAPDWYIRRNKYGIVSMAPVVLISGLGLLLCVFAPPAWLMPVIFFMSINFASSVGDLYVFIRLLKLPKDAYIQDAGDRMAFFTRYPPHYSE